jgi:hypothetical protein
VEARPKTGDSYFQEFYEDVAEDEGEVIATKLHVDIDFGSFNKVIKILDTSSFELDVGAFKYYAPNIGMVTEEEFVFGEPEPELIIDLQNIRVVDNS